MGGHAVKHSRSGPRLAAAGGVLFLLACGFSGPAAADNYLAAFAGNWIGQGAVRPSPDAAPEAVYCRIAAELSADGNMLQQNGRCAGGNESGRISGLLQYDPARRTVTGQWQGGRRGAATLTGQRRGNRLVVELRFESGPEDRFTMTLEPLTSGRYRMSLSGGAQGEILFERQ